MSNKRQADYDGHLNYEYIKIQSTASSNLTQRYFNYLYKRRIL